MATVCIAPTLPAARARASRRSTAPGTRAPALLLDDADEGDLGRTVDGLDHVVDRQRRGRDGDERLHLHAGALAGGDLGAQAHLPSPDEVEVDADVVEAQRMA